MATRFVMQRDTRAWRLQVRMAFGLAVLCAAIGILRMPGEDLDRAFLAIGMFFCLFATFSVAKTMRDNRDGQVDTAAWVTSVWIAFAAAVLLTAWGLWRMNIGEWQKYYMLVTWLFLVSSTFTLAKTVRDAQEADLLERRASSQRDVATPD
jgi:hypothetical protein